MLSPLLAASARMPLSRGNAPVGIRRVIATRAVDNTRYRRRQQVRVRSQENRGRRIRAVQSDTSAAAAAADLRSRRERGRDPQTSYRSSQPDPSGPHRSIHATGKSQTRKMSATERGWRAPGVVVWRQKQPPRMCPRHSVLSACQAAKHETYHSTQVCTPAEVPCALRPSLTF
jgi:hypothetical protein